MLLIQIKCKQCNGIHLVKRNSKEHLLNKPICKRSINLKEVNLFKSVLIKIANPINPKVISKPVTKPVTKPAKPIQEEIRKVMGDVSYVIKKENVSYIVEFYKSGNKVQDFKVDMALNEIIKYADETLKQAKGE